MSAVRISPAFIRVPFFLDIYAQASYGVHRAPLRSTEVNQAVISTSSGMVRTKSEVLIT